MRAISRTMRALASAAVIGLASSCHIDGLGTHNCDPWYSADWDDYDLELVHNEPRTCPVYLADREDPVYTSVTITDGGERNFSTSRLRIRNTSLYVLNDQFDSFDVDLSGNWSANFAANWRAGTGSYPCYDEIFYEMAAWVFPQAGGLPYADGQFTYLYTDDPVCGDA